MEDDFARSLHHLRTLVAQSIEAGQRQIALFSPRGGEGTTTIALQLAHLLATRSFMRVLLVDANFVRPMVHSMLAARAEEGFCDLLAEKIDSMRAVQDVGDFDVMSCGELTDAPSRLLTRERLRKTLPDLTLRFDCVLYDCAPVLETPEMEMLIGAVNGAVMVIEAERTRREVALAASRAAQDAGAKMLGVVLNRRHMHIPKSIYQML